MSVHCYVKYDVNLSKGVGNGYVNTGLALSKDEYVAILGKENNNLYLVFNQYGWEDVYPGDGVELVRIAQKFLTELTDSTHSDILEKWTVYVMCDANPNGILNGEDHQGIGRTVPYSGVDMNRAWPTNNWTQSSVAIKGKKGYTGSNPTNTCLELKQVKTLLESNPPNSRYRNILIDIHGWDCETIGDSKIGAYYDMAETFSSSKSGINFFSKLYGHGFQHRSTFGEGYLATWAKQKLGADYSIILELPYPQDSSVTATADNTTIEKYDFAGRFIKGTLNILNNEAIE